MPYTKAFREEVEEKLSAAKMIRSRPMFGGVGIYAEELMFAIIDDDKLFFKVNDTNRQDYIDKGMDRWAIANTYYEVPADILDDPAELGVWIDKCLRVAESKKK